MPNNAYASAGTQMAVGLETTRGTPSTKPFWIPVKAPKYKPDLTLITDDTLQGSMVATYDMVRGLRYDSHGWDSFPYLDSFPVLLCAELGSSDKLTAAGANTTLSAAAAVGATTITTAAALTANTYVVVGSGATLETHFVSSVATDTATLSTPLIYAQASGAAVTSLTSHGFSLLNNVGQGNQPPSCTLLDYDEEEWRQLTAAQLSKLTIKGNAEGLVDYTCDWFANAATNPAAPSVSYSDTEAVPGWSAEVSIGGSVVSGVMDWEIDLDRQVKPIPALTGSQAYFLYFAGPIKATGKLTVVVESGAPRLSEYLAGSKEALDITVYDVASGYALNLHSSKAIFTTGEEQRSKEWPEDVLDIELLPSATDATAGGVSPIIATVANATTVAYA